MISAVVLSHNDCLHIERTLQSLIWCDEIIVVDDSSTDETVEIVHKVCKVIKFVKYKVFQRKLHDDFSAQRNFGLSKATGEWALFVDSDEVVTEELSEEIKHIMDSRLRGNDEVVGYYVKRKDFIFGKWFRYGETGNIKLLRFAKRDAGRWIRPVHEVWEVTGQTGTLKSPLLHYPHPNVAQFLTEINKYSTLNAQHLYKTHAPTHAWHIVAYPTAKFFLNYTVRLGFLDGMQGLVVALMMSFHSFLSRAKLYLKYRNHA